MTRSPAGPAGTEGPSVRLPPKGPGSPTTPPAHAVAFARAAPAGIAAGGGVEGRRLRTWESDTRFDPDASWRIIARYHVVRLLRSWWQATLLVVVAVYLVGNLGAYSFAIAQGNGPNHYEVAGGVATYLAPGLLFAFVVGAGILADDLRLRAPLFYFSRPVGRAQYLKAKAVFLGGLVATLSLLPLLLAWLLYLAYGWFVASPPSYASVERWHLSHADTFPEAFVSGLLALAGAASVLAFFTSATLVASAYTQRAWHAGVAVAAGIGAWSVLGIMATDLVGNTVYENVFGPIGWVTLVVSTPQQGLFGLPAYRWDLANEQGYSASYATSQIAHLEGWPGAVVLGHLLLLGCSAVCLLLASRRVERQEVDL